MLALRTRAQQKTIVKRSLLAAAKTLAVLVVCAVVLVLLGSLVDFFNRSSHVSQMQARTDIVDMMSGKTPDEIKVIADTLLDLHMQDQTTIIDNAGDSNMDISFALQTASATGSIPEILSQDKPVEPSWLTTHFKLEIQLLLLLLTVLVTAYYVESCFDNDRYVADLNWKAPLTYLLLALLFPLGWLFLIVSATRLLNRPVGAPRREDAQDEQNRPQHDEEEYVEDYDWYGGEGRYYEDETSRASVRFAEAPVAARFRYIELRTKAYFRSAHRREASLAEDIQDSEQTLRSYGQRIQESQQLLAEQRAQHAKLVAAREATGETVSAEVVSMEFDRLMQFRGVTAIRVVNDQISLLVEPVIVYKGVGYDIGSWELRVGEASDTLESRELRTGVRKSWMRDFGRGRHPDYRYPSVNRFCFGSRQYEIDDHVRRGQLLEAFDLAIDCMHSTNSGEKKNVPDAFRKAKREEETCPQDDVTT